MMDHYDISPPRSWRHHQNRMDGWGQEGTLLSWSVVRVGPVGLVEKTPYVVGLVELVQGKRMLAQITDVDLKDLRAGMKCTGVVRRLCVPAEDQLITYGVKFVPVSDLQHLCD